MRALNSSSVPPVAINYVLNLNLGNRFVGNGLGVLDRWFDSLSRLELASSLLLTCIELCRLKP